MKKVYLTFNSSLVNPLSPGIYALLLDFPSFWNTDFQKYSLISLDGICICWNGTTPPPPRLSFFFSETMSHGATLTGLEVPLVVVNARLLSVWILFSAFKAYLS